MSNLSVKRQRANTNGDVTVVSKSPDEYRRMIAAFDENTLRDLLLSAATNSSQVAALVTQRYEISRMENARVVDEKAQGMDLVTTGKEPPAKKSQKNKEAKVRGVDM